MSSSVQAEKNLTKQEQQDFVHHRRLRIIIDKVNTNDYNTVVGKRHGVTAKTVQRALEWGRDVGFFEVDAKERLFHHILELAKQQEWLKSERDIVMDAAKGKNGKRIPMPPKYVTAFSRELRELTMKLLELEGLYKNVTNVTIVDEEEDDDEDEMVVRWEVVYPDDEAQEA